MAFPATVTQATIRVGNTSGFLGLATDVQVIVTPLVAGKPATLTHASSGEKLARHVITRSAPPGVGATFSLPHVNLTGFVDDASGAATSGWAYRLEVSLTAGAATRRYVKVIAPRSGEPELDLDTAPSYPAARGASAGTSAPRSPNTIALLGDSLTAITTETVGVYTSRSSRGFFTWAMQRLGYRLQLVSRPGTHNGGVSGQQVAQMAARLGPDVLDLRPGYVHVLAGTNDVANLVPLATTIAGLTDIYDRVQAAGIRLIVGTVPPVNLPRTDEVRDLIEALNNWIRAEARARPGVILVDYHAVLTAPDGQWRGSGNAWSHDGLHPSSGGALRMGEALAEALAPHVPLNPPLLPSSNRDSAVAPSAPVPNLLANPLMVGTTGGMGSSGGTGQLATSWSLASYQGGGSTAGATLSKVPRTDGQPGEWQQITTTSVDARVRIQQEFPTSASVAVGDRFVGLIEYELENISALTLFRVQLLTYDGNAGYANRGTTADPGLEAADTATLPVSKLPARGVLMTPPLTYAQTATALNFAFDFSGVGTVRVSRAALRRYR